MKVWLEEDGFETVLREFKLITFESAFVVRTFFFVAFGMSIVLAQLGHFVVFAVSLIAIVAIYGTRVIGLAAFRRKNITPELWVAPRGLITILLYYQIPDHLKSEAFEDGILLLTIIITSLIMTFGLIKYTRGKASAVVVDEGVAMAESGVEGAVVTESSESVVGEEE